jgi:hypothetical protein
MCGFELPGDVRRQLKALDKQWQDLGKEILRWTYDAARVAFAKHQEQIAGAAAKGTLAELHTKSLADFAADHATKLRAAKLSQAAVAREMMNLIKPHCDALVSRMLDLAAEIEFKEQNLHESLGVKYSPSAVTLAIRKAVALIGQTLSTFSPNSGSRPLDCLSILQID